MTPDFVLARDAAAAGADDTLRRMHRRAELVRVRRGVYLRRADADALHADPDASYRTRIHAAATQNSLLHPLSHDSAAALWRLPSIGPWPAHIHMLGAPASGGRSYGDIRVHGVTHDPHSTHREQLHVTSITRTLIDMACTTSFPRAVAMLDHGMRTHLTNAPSTDETHRIRDLLRDALDDLLPYRGSRRASAVIDFSESLAASALESLSRTQMARLRVPPPELQVPFHDEAGLIGYVDFYWPEHDLIGECDGDIKYRGAASPSGQPADHVVREEKHREDRLRRVARGFVRWDWVTARDPKKLAARLAPHGLLR